MSNISTGNRTLPRVMEDTVEHSEFEGISHDEEVPNAEEAESPSMDEQLDRIASGLMADDDEPEPQEREAAPEPDEGEPEAEGEPKDEGDTETKPEPVDPPSFLNEQERERFNSLPAEAQQALVRMGKEGQRYFTQTSQQLAEERKRLAAMEGLFNQMQSDPNYAQHVLRGYQPQPQQPEGPPEDPVEALKWEAKQEALRELNPRFEEQQRQMQEFQKKVELDQARSYFQSDPDYQDVQGAIIDHLKSLPRTVGEPLYRQLDSDPRAYAEMYQHMKAQVAGKKKQAPEQAPKPEPQKRQQRAPLLEGSGPATETQEAQKRKKNKRMKAEALASGSLDDIAGYLTSSGLIDHIA